MDGICTLANDKVYDQLVALLNSIEAVLGPQMPVCVYPYDDNTAAIAAEIDRRPQVQLYEDRESMDRWDRFVRKVWDVHPTAKQRWRAAGLESYHRVGAHRRYCAFDGPFDRFLYMDADTLVMGPVDPVFDRLNDWDWVVYDFQHKDITHVYDVSSKKLAEIFTPERLASDIFCSGLYGSKRNMFPQERRDWLLDKLTGGEAEVLYIMAADQPVLNYMVMRTGISSYNFAIYLPPEERTGCCVTSDHFEERDHILYDKDKRLTYIHYIGIGSKYFTRLCAGENLDLPYREVFLYYRYLHEPEKRPQFTGKPKLYNAPPSLAKRVLRKLGLTG